MTAVRVAKEYEAKLDSKRRILLRQPDENAETANVYERYLVRHMTNGVIELRPQVMTDVASISNETLQMIDLAMQNLNEGTASDPVDLDKEYPDF